MLSIFGADSHGEADSGGAEFDSGKFQWLTKQALTGFLLMFGWAGLTCIKEFELSILAATTISFFAGLISTFVTSFIFKMAKKLRSSGTVFRIDDAVGKEATIYQRIPKKGIGKITLSLNNFTHELDAISTHYEDLPSFTSVQIIKKADDKTVVVVPLGLK